MRCLYASCSSEKLNNSCIVLNKDGFRFWGDGLTDALCGVSERAVPEFNGNPVSVDFVVRYCERVNLTGGFCRDYNNIILNPKPLNEK